MKGCYYCDHCDNCKLSDKNAVCDCFECEDYKKDISDLCLSDLSIEKAFVLQHGLRALVGAVCDEIKIRKGVQCV